MFGLRKSDLISPRNGLLIHKELENAFDGLQSCFLYDPFKVFFFTFLFE